MNKITTRNKLIIGIAICALVVFGVISNAQSIKEMSAEAIFYLLVPNAAELIAEQDWYMDDDFWRSAGREVWVSTELLPNDTNSDLSITVSVHRYNRFPRFGIPTVNNNGEVLDTVWYISADYAKFDGTTNIPKFTDTSVTVYWYETPFCVLMLDVLTGDTVLQEVHRGQPASMFEDSPTTSYQFYDSIDASGNLSSPSFALITSANSHPYKLENNLGTTINYGHLPKGSYFIFIIDVNAKTIATTRTIRMGV